MRLWLLILLTVYIAFIAFVTFGCDRIDGKLYGDVKNLFVVVLVFIIVLSIPISRVWASHLEFYERYYNVKNGIIRDDNAILKINEELRGAKEARKHEWLTCWDSKIDYFDYIHTVYDWFSDDDSEICDDMKGLRTR